MHAKINITIKSHKFFEILIIHLIPHSIKIV